MKHLARLVLANRRDPRLAGLVFCMLLVCAPSAAGTPEEGGTRTEKQPPGPAAAPANPGATARRSKPATSERAVAAALNWLARHQSPDGSWSFREFNRRCHDATCTGEGSIQTDTGATALGLLPFLAAGQTHKTRGPYKGNVREGLYALIKRQKPNGDLTGDGNGEPWVQGAATVCLVEAYGVAADDALLAEPARKAVSFIVASQDKKPAGGSGKPGANGPWAVGWQLMALDSARLAGLDVKPESLSQVKKRVRVISGSPSPTLTALDLLCSQSLGLEQEDDRVRTLQDRVMAHMPDAARQELELWWFATQAMHKRGGPPWDTWNRAMRKALIGSQCCEGCAAGSWASSPATKDAGDAGGGRLMATSLSTLTLEIYYRYLPLFKLTR